MKQYPDWAPKKRNEDAAVRDQAFMPREEEKTPWEGPAEQAGQVRQRAAGPVRECPVCRVAMELLEAGGFLLCYQAISKTMPNLAGVPHYHEADLYVCPVCGRYDFFRPVGESAVDSRFEAFRRCSDEQLEDIAEGYRGTDMGQAAQTILEHRRGEEQ